jgi:hypothetical protein
MAETSLTATPQQRWHWLRRVFVALVLGLAIGFGALLCFAPGVQRRSTGIFGGLAQRVKNRPAEAAVLCAGSLVLLWGGVGLLAAGQEVRARLTGRKGNPS